MHDINDIGRKWLIEEVGEWTDVVRHISPSEFVEKHRYLPASVTPAPGPFSYDRMPFMREIVDCFDVDSPVREVTLMKGVQIGFTTGLLECGLLYFMGHVKTAPILYMTADAELAQARLENNIIPMIQQSDMMHLIRSSDTKAKNKVGLTKKHIQWEGGGYMIPFGAINANKLRQQSFMVILKDELDAWPDSVGKDGDPDKLSDARATAYMSRRKIFRGSTPLIKDTSKIYVNYLLGDQRVYKVLCRHCGYPQHLEWEKTNTDSGLVYGIQFDMEEGQLIQDSVRYVCKNCGHEHFEADKSILFSPEHGAYWEPQAIPKRPGVRSYHLPGLYSPYGFKSWADQVGDWLEAFDPIAKRVLNMQRFQVFYNNVLGWPFDMKGSKVRFEQVSAHRRSAYRMGEIPNKYAIKNAGSQILMIVLTVDLQKEFIRVAATGWCRNGTSFLIDYWNFEDELCTDINSPVWAKVDDLIRNKVYIADDGSKYPINLTFIDANYESSTVINFCSRYPQNVYPIFGRDSIDKRHEAQGFQEGTTSMNTSHILIRVDKYKDEWSNILRREWSEVMGMQPEGHFNAPVDIPDSSLKELTVERKVEKVDEKGNRKFIWKRPQGSRNELWDLIVYARCAIEFTAYKFMIEYFEEDKLNMTRFWDYIEEHKFFFLKNGQ